MKTKLFGVTAVLLALVGFSNGSTAKANDLFVSNIGNGTIVRYDSSGNETVFASGLNGPWGLAFDGAGNLYVATFYGGEIVKFTPDGSASVFASGLNHPVDPVFDNSGNLYIASPYGNTIEKFDTNGVGTVFASGVKEPSGLAIDSAGNVYASIDSGIEKFTPAGVGSLYAYTGPGYAVGSPESLAFDNNTGNLFAAQLQGSGGDRILKITPLGQVAIIAIKQHVPQGLVLDSAGNLYFAEAADNTVVELDLSGTITTVEDSGMDVPYGLAFDTIPEPSALALAMIGVVGMGLVVRRRRSAP